jgi:antitoxin component YwqK of YwqJK toxin-antitoxin module
VRLAFFISFCCLLFECDAQQWDVFQDDTAFFYGTRTASQKQTFQLRPDVPDGQYKVYFPQFILEDSVIHSQFNWKSGRIEGNFNRWNIDGKRILEYSLDSAGNYAGRYYLARENGLVKQTGQYIHGKKDGEWLNYESDGRVYSRTNYEIGCITENEYWKYEILMPEFTRKQILEANDRAGEQRFKRRGKSKLISRKVTTYDSCVIRESSLFDPAGRLLETVTFGEK